MRNWLARPQRDDEYETFSACVLHYTLLLLMGVSLMGALFSSSKTQLIFIPVVFLLFSGCYYLLHKGRFRLASLIFLSGLWMVVTFASFSLNGLRNASLSTYTVVIIFSAILISSRAVAAYTILSLLSTTVLVFGELGGALPLHSTPLYMTDRFLQLVTLFGAAGVLLSASSRVIRMNYQRIRAQEDTLRERNRALEIEIEERRQTEENLRLSEARYRLLFENIPVMAGVYARDGKIVLVNRAAAQTLGGTPETIQGRYLQEFLTPEAANLAIKNHTYVLEEGKDMLTEGDTATPSGSHIYYMRHVMPLPKPDNQPADQVLVLTTDLTEKYMSEQREQELTLTREKNTFLTDFFSTLSHDLKTPLAVINTSLYLLKHAKTTQQRDEKIARVSEQIAIMDEYLQDMLTISRLEYLPTLKFQDLDLNQRIQEVIHILRPRIEGKQQQCRFISDTDIPLIQGDEDQIQRMLVNLIENAVNYTPRGGHVTITTRQVSGHVVLEVSDSGIGIEPESMPHIFERFFRTSQAKASQAGGTGLGLAIVKKIIETHGAAIEVQSQVGKGTTFKVEFLVTLVS